MTEVSKMTDLQINRALAEWLEPTMDSWQDGWFPGCEIVPDYCTSPAASLEVQAAALEKNNTDYLLALYQIVRGKPFSRREFGFWEVGLLLTATPRQRAEAAFLTLRGEGT